MRKSCRRAHADNGSRIPECGDRALGRAFKNREAEGASTGTRESFETLRADLTNLDSLTHGFGTRRAFFAQASTKTRPVAGVTARELRRNEKPPAHSVAEREHEGKFASGRGGV